MDTPLESEPDGRGDLGVPLLAEEGKNGFSVGAFTPGVGDGEGALEALVCDHRPF